MKGRKINGFLRGENFTSRSGVMGPCLQLLEAHLLEISLHESCLSLPNPIYATPPRHLWISRWSVRGCFFLPYVMWLFVLETYKKRPRDKSRGSYVPPAIVKLRAISCESVRWDDVKNRPYGNETDQKGVMWLDDLLALDVFCGQRFLGFLWFIFPKNPQEPQ